MKMLIIIKVLILLAVWNIKAQSISPQSVNSVGIKMSQSNGSLSFTVGELVIAQQFDINGNSLGNGFINGATTTIVSVLEPENEVLLVDIFPNPTKDLFQIQVKNSSIEEMDVVITNMLGITIFNSRYKLIQQSIGINTANYPIGSYLLSIKNTQGKILGTYKLVKQ